MTCYRKSQAGELPDSAFLTPRLLASLLARQNAGAVCKRRIFGPFPLAPSGLRGVFGEFDRRIGHIRAVIRAIGSQAGSLRIPIRRGRILRATRTLNE